MNSEKVKEIKECLNREVEEFQSEFCQEILTLINDLENRLEVERIVLKERSAKLEKAEHDRDRYSRRIDKLESENEKLMKLQARGGYRVAELGIENHQLKDRIAELEDKIENGTLIELPCKVGDTIYTIQNAPIMHIEVVESIQIYSNKIKFITKDRFNGGFWFYYLEDFGEIAFTDKAEAEAKLKELKGEQKND